MMHFHRHSPYLCELFHAMATGPAPRKGTTDWGSFLYHQVWRRLVAAGYTPFKVLPYCFTDGRSCRLDSRLPDPFDPGLRLDKWGEGRVDNLRDKVESVWAVHLHNQWEKSFPVGGWIDRFILSKIEAAEKQYRLAP